MIFFKKLKYTFINNLTKKLKIIINIYDSSLYI